MHSALWHTAVSSVSVFDFPWYAARSGDCDSCSCMHPVHLLVDSCWVITGCSIACTCMFLVAWLSPCAPCAHACRQMAQVAAAGRITIVCAVLVLHPLRWMRVAGYIRMESIMASCMHDSRLHKRFAAVCTLGLPSSNTFLKQMQHLCAAWHGIYTV